MTGIHITGLSVRSYAGLKVCDLEPGRVTILTGPNGSGKTSVLKAIRAALERGGIADDAINIDSERAEITVECSDGTKIRRTKSRGGSQQIKVTKEGMTAQSPQALLSGLIDPVGLDPVAWLNGDRTKALLDALPLSITRDELEAIAEAANLPKAHLPAITVKGRHALEVLGEVERQLVKTRRDANAEAKQCEVWLEKERAAATIIEDPTDAIAAITAAIAGHKVVLDRANEITVQHAQYASDLVQAADILQARKNRVEELEDMLQIAQVDLAAAEKHMAELKTRELPAPVDVQDTKMMLHSADGQLEALREQQARYKAALQTAGRLEAEAARLAILRDNAVALDRGVKAFRAAPQACLAKAELPIDGLMFDDGRLCLNNVPITQLSGAETIRLAAKVALHRVRQQRGQFVLLDGLEALDTEQRAALMDEIRTSDVQWICTEVLRRDKAVGDETLVVLSRQA